jgi:hypothetical protein
MIALLRKGNRLRLVSSNLHAQSVAGRCYAQVLIAQPAYEVERLTGGLLARKSHCIVTDPLFDRGSYVRRRAEESICRDQPAQGLVRALKVVGVNKERNATRAVRKVREHGTRQKLVPERFPEAFHFPKRLRVLGPALDVPNAVLPELSLELGLSSPGRVLPALVRENLAGRAVVRNPAGQGLHHKRASLMVRQTMRYQVARVVVHEACEVEPLVLAKQESEYVRLPELVGLSSLEAPRRVLAGRLRPLFNQPGLVQDAPHIGLAHANGLKPRQHIAHSARAELGVLVPDPSNCLLPRLCRC